VGCPWDGVDKDGGEGDKGDPCCLTEPGDQRLVERVNVLNQGGRDVE